MSFKVNAATYDTQTDWLNLKTSVQRLQAEGHADQALSLLLSSENQLSGITDFDYTLGVLALELGQLGLAQNAFERVVLVNPNHVGAWLDIAITNFKLGDIDATRQVIQHIEENFNPSGAFKEQLAHVKKQMAVNNITQPWHGSAAIYYGYVQNPNGGLSDSRFSLTPIGSLPFPVDVAETMRPKSDHVRQFRGNAYRTYKHEYAESTFSGTLLLKDHRQQTNNDLIDAMLAWNYRQPISQDKTWLINISPNFRTIVLNGETLGYFTTLSAGISKKHQTCETGVRVDIEKRHYVLENYFNSTTPWIGLGLDCLKQDMLYGASMRYGRDFTQTDRPGGDTKKLEFNAYLRKLLNKRITLSFAIYAAENNDMKGFSTLLDNNNKRNIHRLSQRAELVWLLPKTTQWAFQAELEHSRDRSNIPTSRIEDKQLLLGLRYQF